MSRTPSEGIRTILNLAALALLALALGSCVVGVEGNTGSIDSTGRTIEVRFQLEASGSAWNVDRIDYRVGDIARTQSFPALPWVATVAARPGDAISVRADASVSGDTRLALFYEAVRDGRVVARGRQTCSQVGCPGFQLAGTLPR